MENNYYEVTEADFELTDDEQWDIAMEGYMEYDYERGPKQALEELFKSGNWDDDFLSLPFYQRWFYWFKTLVCLCFGRLNARYPHEGIGMMNWDIEGISTENGSGENWRTCWVERGLFKNWQVECHTDSSF